MSNEMAGESLEVITMAVDKHLAAKNWEVKYIDILLLLYCSIFLFSLKFSIYIDINICIT